MIIRKTEGLTLVEIMVVVMIIGLLLGLAIPGFMKSRQTTQKQLCLENQRLIRDMLSLYCLDNKTAPSLANFANITAVKNAIAAPDADGNDRYIKKSNTFDCPAQGDGSENDYELIVVDNVIIGFKCSIVAEHNTK